MRLGGLQGVCLCVCGTANVRAMQHLFSPHQLSQSDVTPDSSAHRMGSLCTNTALRRTTAPFLRGPHAGILRTALYLRQKSPRHLKCDISGRITVRKSIWDCSTPKKCHNFRGIKNKK